MSALSTETTDEEAATSSGENRALSTIKKRGADGSMAMVAGGVLLAWALKSRRNGRGRATLLTLACFAAFGLGLRQRRAGLEDGTATEADVRRDEQGRKTVADASRVERAGELGAGRNADESAGVSQSETETNPRGVSDGADRRSDEGGDIDFVEGETAEPRRETHLEDEDAHDPRLHPANDDERTAVDLSEAAMADEASEAVGPHPEQAYPAREGTDPEPTSAEAPEWVDEATDAPADSTDDGGRTGDEAQDRDD